MVTHIRQRMPRKGGNSFYRDKTDYSKFAVTLCGAPITDRDVDYFTANTKRFRTSGWPVCLACRAKQDEMQDAIIASLPDVFPKAAR